MRRRSVGLVLVMVLCLVGSASLAYGLWSDHQSLAETTVGRGAVSFAVQALGDSTVSPTPIYATAADTLTPGARAPLTVTLPGAGVSDATQVWGFAVLGYVRGSAGLAYAISYNLSGAGDPTATPASPALQFFRSKGADCSDLSPIGAEVVAATNGSDGVTRLAEQSLQPAGFFSTIAPQAGSTVTPTPIRQVWCVTASAGASQSAGDHTDQVTADARGTNQVDTRATHTWSVKVGAPASSAADVVVSIQPRLVEPTES